MQISDGSFAAEKAAARSPEAYEAGEAAGLVAPLLIPGAQEAEGASLLSRLAGTAGEGAAYMGLTSDAETPEGVATDGEGRAVSAGARHAVVGWLGRRGVAAAAGGGDAGNESEG